MMKRTIHLVTAVLGLLCLSAFAWGIVPTPDPVPPPTATYPPLNALLNLTPQVAQVVGSIGEALDKLDSTNVSLGGTTGKVVIADQADTGGSFCYIEEDDRSSGVRVGLPAGTTVHRGDRVTVTGVMSTIDGHERCITASDVTVISQGSFLPRPLGMENRALAGGNLNLSTPGRSPNTVITTPLLAPYNKGLLVRTWGRVTYAGSSIDGKSYFTVSDARTDYSTSNDAAGDADVRVVVNDTVELPQVGTYSVVTGVCSSYKPDTTHIAPLIRTRDAADIVTPATEDLTSPTSVLPGSATGWAMISLPGVPYVSAGTTPTYNAHPMTVFANALSALPRHELDSNFSKWNPTMPQDEETSLQWFTAGMGWGGDELSAVYSGSEGYYLQYNSAGTIQYRAVAEPLPQTDRYIPLLATGGWNMIGYPYKTPTELADMHVTDGYRTLTLRQASQLDQGWMQSTGFWWQASNQSQYDADLAEQYPTGGTTMEPWHSYTVASHRKCALVIPSPIAALDLAAPPAVDVCQDHVDVQARLIKGGQPIAGQLVNFHTTCGVFANNGQATTNSSGIATATLSRATGQLYGSAAVTADATVSGTLVSAAPVNIAVRGWVMSLIIGPSTTVPYNTAVDVSARLTTDDGSPVAGQSVTLSLPAGTQYTFGNGQTTYVGTTAADGTITGTTITIADHPVTVTITATATASCNSGMTATDSKQLTVMGHIMHVKPGGNDSNSGLTWGSAKATVQAAITAAALTTDKEVWVAAGTYSPASSIALSSGVAVYGGFAGNEVLRSARNWTANRTVLDGSDPNLTDRIVKCEDASSGNVIDGFTITNGRGGGVYCSDSSPTIAHNTVISNKATSGSGWGNGGGVCCYGGSPVITNNIIRSNAANGGYGGGIYCESCDSVQIVNNAIMGNDTDYGAGMYLLTVSSGLVANNTITHNTATVETGGVYYLGSPSVTLANNIIAYNYGHGLYLGAGEPTLSCNYAFGNTDDAEYSQYDGVTLADPKLAQDSIHIQSGSPCRNTGDNSLVATGATDIDGQVRVLDNTVDIGADESDDCVWYDLLLDGDNAAFMPNTVTAHATVRDPVANNAPVQNYRVDFSVTGGQMASISPNGTIDSSATTGYGYTDSSGVVTVHVGSTSEGHATLTASVQQSCSSARMELSRAKSLYFDSGDWRMFHKDVALTGVTAAPLSNNLTKKWRVDLAGDLGDTSQILWSSPVVANGVVYVGVNNLNGTLYAVNASTGAVITSRNLGSPIYGTPCVSGGSVYVCTKQTSGLTGSGVLYVLNGSSLSTEWTYSCPTLLREFWGSPTVCPASNAVYVGAHFYPGIRTVDLDTHLDRANSPATTAYAPDFVTPALDTALGRVYVSDYSCYLTAARMDTGAWVWEWGVDEHTPMYASPVVYDGYIFVGADNGYVYRRKDNGSGSSQLSPYGPAEGMVRSTPAAWDGNIYFGSATSTGGGHLYCVDATLSSPLSPWSVSLGSPVTSSPAISASTGYLFVGTENGRVYAVNSAGGAVTQMYDIRAQDSLLQASIKSSPAIAQDKLYIVAGDANGRYLYCFGP